MSEILKFAQTEPIVSFSLLLAIILIVPIWFERLNLPGLIGLLLAGIVCGKNGFQLLDYRSETMKLLSDIGVVYLMFVAGLEMDMEEFSKVKNRAIGFGAFTFLFPLITGTIIGRWFGFGWNAAILIGSLLSSHTPLGYPILSRLGLMRNESVMVTIGGTIFTNIPALLVLAICVAVHQGEFTFISFFTLFLSVIVYSFVVLFGLAWVGKLFFRRSGEEEGNQFLFVLLAVFVASVGAQVIGVEKIVGAFLAGMAVNGVMGAGPVKEKVVFVGSVLFIPIFIVNLGLLVDLRAFTSSFGTLAFSVILIIGLLLSKFIAAVITQWLYRYNITEMLIIWSLSIPQLATTLAATLVGYKTLNPAGVALLDDKVLNGTIVMMLVTATLGPFITERSAVKLSPTSAEKPLTSLDESPITQQQPFTVVVPVYNPETERYLVELAALLTHHSAGLMIPLSVSKVNAQMTPIELEKVLQHSEELVHQALDFLHTSTVNSKPLIRIDHDVALGITHATREQRANLIVMGWSPTTSLKARLFGSVINRVLWLSSCPVAVTRLRKSPTEIQRILVILDNLSELSVIMLRFAYLLFRENQGQVTLLYLGTRGTPTHVIDEIETQLAILITQWESFNCEFQSYLATDAEKSEQILKVSQDYDLAILRVPAHQSMLGMEFDEVIPQLISQLQCSVVMLGQGEEHLVEST